MNQADIDNYKIDKSEFPNGEWSTEPDRIDFEFKGFPCLILRSSLGHLCGYVGLPSDHEYYKKSYNDIDINVHGGLTYGEECDGKVICHVTSEPDNRYWIGFDCAHSGDVSPSLIKCRDRLFEHESYKNIQYVRNEIESMVNQLLGEE